MRQEAGQEHVRRHTGRRRLPTAPIAAGARGPRANAKRRLRGQAIGPLHETGARAYSRPRTAARGRAPLWTSVPALDWSGSEASGHIYNAATWRRPACRELGRRGRQRNMEVDGRGATVNGRGGLPAGRRSAASYGVGGLARTRCTRDDKQALSPEESRSTGHPAGGDARFPAVGLRREGSRAYRRCSIGSERERVSPTSSPKAEGD